MNPITHSCRILNASTDPAVRAAISRTLAQAGFAVTEAEGAAQTLQELEKELPDLVLLDVAMPGVDGHELCTQIRQRPGAARMPVLFLFAGRMDDHAKARGLNNGADGYLNWPENRDMLVASIKSVLRLRQTEARLCQSEEQFRTTVEQAAVGLGHLTLDGEWTWVNRRLCQILGYTREELLQKTCLDVVCPEGQQTLLEHQRRVLAGEAESFALEQRCRRKDGSEFWASWTVSLGRGPSGEARHLLAAIDDISVRKWTEEHLLVIRAGIEGSSEAIAVADAGGRHTYHNRAFARMFGYGNQELSEPLTHLALFADQAAGRAAIEIVMQGQSWQGEIDMVAKDGRRFPVELRADAIRDERGQFVGLILVLTDISGRRSVQAALARSEERFRALFEFAPDGIYLVDLQGNFVDGNKAAEKLIGYAREDVIGKSFQTLNLMAPSDLLKAAENLGRHARGELTGPGEFVLNRKDGRQVPVEIRAFRITIGDQPLVLGIARDLTERKQLEGQFRQAQKMEAVGQLAGGIAHDFNNMLAVIRGNADLLLMDGEPLKPASADCLNHLIAASERAANLTRQLLIFSRKQVMQSQPLALNDLVENLTKMLKRTIREDIRLECAYADPLPLVQADPGMLEQVLLNLVVNARDAMPGGGQIRIATETVALDEECIRGKHGAKPGSFVCLSVTDTGTGIAPEHLTRIFDPFFTTKEPGKGTGLGLATVYGIVQQHQGWVEVASQVGTGATFKVLLPTLPRSVNLEAAQQAEERLPKRHRDDPAGGRRLRGATHHSPHVGDLRISGCMMRAAAGRRWKPGIGRRGRSRCCSATS